LSVSAKLFLSDSDTNQRREQVRGHPIYSLVPPNPDKPEIRNSPDLIKLAEIRNKFESPRFK
jgi:hypothetical protein